MATPEIPSSTGISDLAARRAIEAIRVSLETLSGRLGSVEDHAVTKGALKAAGLIGLSGATIYDSSKKEVAAFDAENRAVPAAPTALTAYITTANIAMLSWTIPPFQPPIDRSDVWELTAPAFRDTESYAIGHFVTYAATVYKFTTAHTPGAWNAGQVVAAGAGDLVIANATTRHNAPATKANISLDIGGTSYFWVRLVSNSDVVGAFSSSVAVSATSKTISGAIPVGAEIWAQASPGIAYLEAAGQTGLVRNNYPDLYAWANAAGIVFTEATKLAGQYGNGDGSTTFSLPDYRGRAPVAKSAAGTFSTIGAVGGAETHTLVTAELPVHTHAPTDPGHAHAVTDAGHAHAVTDPGHTHTTPVGAAGAGSALSGDGTGTTASGSSTTGLTVNNATTGLTVNSTTTGITIGNAGSGTAHNNLQPYVVSRCWIRAVL